MGKIIFLDVDGTLCNHEGRVPASAKLAIRQAQENGHQFYLCTGRSKAELTEEVLAIEPTGIIGAGGGYVEHLGQVLLHQTFEETELRGLLTYLDSNHIAYYLESNQGLFASKHLIPTLKNLLLTDNNDSSTLADQHLSSFQWFFDLLKEDWSTLDYHDINKVSFINQHMPYEEIYANYQGRFTMLRSTVPLFGKDSGEISLPGVNKQTAIEVLLDYLAIDTSQTLAFGDGSNDLDMFNAAGTGIAMGNASAELLAVADDVTTSHDEDGIALGLKKYGLL